MLIPPLPSQIVLTGGSAPELTVMLASSAGMATHRSYPSGREARLIVPLNHRWCRKGLRFFFPYKTRLGLQIRSLRQFLRRVPSRDYFCEGPALREIKSKVGAEALHAVIRLGTPGPFRKQTVLFLNENGQEVAVAKIGSTPLSIRQVQREVEWLRRLSAEPSMRKYTPTLLADGKVADAWMVMQGVCSGAFVSSKPGFPHIRFLSAFQDLFREECPYHETQMYREMSRRFEALTPHLSQIWMERASRAFSHLDAGYADGPTTVVAAQRDFAPWNMRLRAGQLAVFDWEYASFGYLPLYDLFHFFLMPLAVRSSITFSKIKHVLGEVTRLGTLIAGSPQGCKAPSLQLLAYLLDVSLFYLESRDGLDTGDTVMDCFGQLIDQFPLWRFA